MKLLALVVLAIVLPLHAQTAKVIALSPADAAEAKNLYAQRDAIQKRIDDLQKKIEGAYLMEEKPGPSPFTAGNIISCIIGADGSCHSEPEVSSPQKKKVEHHLERKAGWYGFEFSEDFKFIVPLIFKQAPSTTCSANPGWTLTGELILENFNFPLDTFPHLN